jgi:predicted Zn-ribbon and HTH transcriptional regulator
MNRQEALAALKSSDSLKITEALKFVRESGDNKLLEQVLIILRDTDNSDIRLEVINLINDLRNKDCKSVIFNALNDDTYALVHKYIISSCWQNAIDFSDDIMLFIDMLPSADFETAIEIFSVVDNFIEEITEDDKQKILELLNKTSESVDENKQALLLELQKLIKE